MEAKVAVRLSVEALNIIKDRVAILDPKADVYPFGSRVANDKQGGDIDLLIFSDSLEQRDCRKIRRFLCDALGEQKIDIVIAHDHRSPFVRLAFEEGVKL